LICLYIYALICIDICLLKEKKKMAYEVLRTLQIPEEAHHQPIAPDALPAFGIVRDAPQDDLLLAQVGLHGALIANKWYVSAYDVMNPPKEGHEEEMYGGIAIPADEVEEPSEVLRVADDWVRESETTAWVPGVVLELNVAMNSVTGVLLVRAGAETPEPTPPQEITPQSKNLVQRIFSRISH
jgi:hypothetical protein